MARNREPETAERTGRLANVRAAYRVAAAHDPRLALRLAVPAVAVLVVLVIIGIALGHPVYFTILGVLLAILVATILFGRRANAAMYAQVEGQVGAAAAVLQAMRGDWRVTPAVAITRSQDLVHRVIGRAGVVLVAEGAPSRVAQLITQEKRKVSRVAADAPIYDVTVGDADGQVPLRKLQSHVNRLPRNLRPSQVNALESRLRAVGGTGMPVPKGPLPRSVRMPRGGRIR